MEVVESTEQFEERWSMKLPSCSEGQQHRFLLEMALNHLIDLGADPKDLDRYTSEVLALIQAVNAKEAQESN